MAIGEALLAEHQACETHGSGQVQLMEQREEAAVRPGRGGGKVKQ